MTVHFSQVRGVLALLRCSPPSSHGITLSRRRGVTYEAAFDRPFHFCIRHVGRSPPPEVVRAAMA